MMTSLRPAAMAFDAIAPNFDTRFGTWLSVAAQREPVRAALMAAFPSGSHVLELGGGTGEDASYLAERGRKVLLTDPSPTMVDRARIKLAPLGSDAAVVAAEDLDEFAGKHLAENVPLFDGAFSNFAPLNCVADLTPVAKGLARLLKPGAPAMLVLFGTICPAEIVVEVLRGRPGQALRRRKRGAVPARLAKRHFHVYYHRRAELERTFAPWFELERTLGIGVTVPPSAAEPWISHHPGILTAMKALDRFAAGPLAMLGDHILYQFRRIAS